MYKIMREVIYAVTALVILAVGLVGTGYVIWNTIIMGPPTSQTTLGLPLPAPWKGDLDGMKERRLIRFIVPHNKTWYFLDGARERGIIHDYAKAFEQWINRKYKTKYNQRIRVIFIPVARDQIFSSLQSGLGDIATGGLTVTPSREETVSFASPLIKDVAEMIVTSPSGPTLNTLDDLAGKEVYVRKSSSYWEHLEALNDKFADENKPLMKLIPADENLEDEDILEMVNADLIDIAITDRYLANYWKKIFTKINIHKDMPLTTGGVIAWGVRKDSPQLKAEIDAFMKNHAFGSIFQKIVMFRYLDSTDYVLNATAQKEMQKFNAVVDFFKRYGSQYDFDYLMLIAQGYQESELNPKARSKKGAVGIMQVLPSTAERPPISIPNVTTNVENNIHAGVKYLHLLADSSVNQPGIDPQNRLLLTFAGYNAGPGNLNKFRKIAKDSRLNPNVWFNNVEFGAARVVGRETVDYVGNIYQYYIAYKLVQERQKQAPKAEIKPQ